ncbi:MAG: IS1634 family transposase [Desulfotomaculales bacterium]
MAALWDQAQQLGLREIIDEVVPQRANRMISSGTYLVVGALNRVLNPTSKNGVGRWMKKTVLPRLLGLPAEAFDSQSFWDATDLVQDEHIARIEEKLWSRILEQHQVLTDTLLYDTTNFATHIDTFTPCSIPRRGKPKQGKPGQRLVGLALACTAGLGIPFLHKVYEGNRHDARLFPELMRKIVDRYHHLHTGAKSVTLVFDKGNNSADNLYWTNFNRAYCIGSLRPTHYPKFLGVPLGRFKERAGDCLLYRTRALVFERPRTVVVVFNPATFGRQKELFQRRLAEACRELERRFRQERCGQTPEDVLLARYRQCLKGKGLEAYLTPVIKGKTERRLEIKFNRAAIAARERTFGKTILFSDREDLTSEQIVQAYHEKYLVEENFRFLKDRHYLRFEPVYHWTDQKIKVHALMCVLALILVKLLQYRLARTGIDLSVNLLLEELEEISEVLLLYDGPRVVRRIARMSSVQNRLWEALELARFHNSG